MAQAVAGLIRSQHGPVPHGELVFAPQQLILASVDKGGRTAIIGFEISVRLDGDEPNIKVEDIPIPEKGDFSFVIADKPYPPEVASWPGLRRRDLLIGYKSQIHAFADKDFALYGGDVAVGVTLSNGFYWALLTDSCRSTADLSTVTLPAADERASILK